MGESLLLLPLHSTTDLSLYFTVGKELSCDRTIWTLRLIPLSAFTLNNTDGTPHATTPNQCSHPGSRNGVTSRACRMNTDPNSRQHRRREFSSSPLNVRRSSLSSEDSSAAVNRRKPRCTCISYSNHSTSFFAPPMATTASNAQPAIIHGSIRPSQRSCRFRRSKAMRSPRVCFY